MTVTEGRAQRSGQIHSPTRRVRCRDVIGRSDPIRSGRLRASLRQLQLQCSGSDSQSTLRSCSTIAQTHELESDHDDAASAPRAVSFDWRLAQMDLSAAIRIFGPNQSTQTRVQSIIFLSICFLLWLHAWFLSWRPKQNFEYRCFSAVGSTVAALFFFSQQPPTRSVLSPDCLSRARLCPYQLTPLR